MSDGMVSIIENKVLRLLSQQTNKINFTGQLELKIKEHLSNEDAAVLKKSDLKGWRQVKYGEEMVLGKGSNQMDRNSSLSPPKKLGRTPGRQSQNVLLDAKAPNIILSQQNKENPIEVSGFACDIRPHQNTSVHLRVYEATIFI